MVEGLKRAGRSGFTLIEAIVGLALLAVATLVGLAAISQAQLSIERVDARHRALAEIEAALEAVRTGSLPLVSDVVGPSLDSTVGRERDLIVLLKVEPSGTPGLYQVAATARWSLRGKPQESTVQTLVYRP
ncbi:MAG TPA: type II secretion system protein [Thermoanaerobaculia bacterium]|jgi:prepilin-type N-terminal cleavage/methylation domain-containing protein|nr:type II secretion system protein [Thermoanaerobaculia bacterium]